MLVALDFLDDRVLAANARRPGDHFCPGCDAQVVLKRGKIVAPHFAHKANSACTYGAGESALHRDVKYAIYTGQHRRGAKLCEMEFHHSQIGRRSDVFAETADGKKIGFEVQVSGITAAEVQERTRAYARIGVVVCWVVPLKGEPQWRWALRPSAHKFERVCRGDDDDGPLGEFVRGYMNGAEESTLHRRDDLYHRVQEFGTRRKTVIERVAHGRHAPKNLRVLYVRDKFDGVFYSCESIPYFVSTSTCIDEDRNIWEVDGYRESEATHSLRVQSSFSVAPPWY